ncbi:uncharacterized protein [Hoplias malabaricus]|uniref:uncharacterized protein isoform X2 n=1 Tax=Hoplias malabaricus TaxID=27720 RepID=UPI0034624494
MFKFVESEARLWFEATPISLNYRRSSKQIFILLLLPGHVVCGISVGLWKYTFQNMAGTSRESYTGACCSIGSLINPGKPESKRTCNSEPFLKPTLSLKNLKDRILKTIQAKIKNPQNDPQQKDFSMEESKCILRKLSTELDRLVPLKGLVMLSEVRNVESPQNESQALDLVLLWADELRSLQNRKCATIQIPVKLKIQPCHEATQNLDKKQQLIDSKIILSDWIRKLKPKESVNVREEQKAVLQDLCKRWKKGQLVDILPIMDFIIRIILWENKSEGNILKEWFKTEEVFHKTGGLCIPVPVWNCITRASAEVILDPNTANPDLKLSKDGCAVRTKTHEECKQNPWDVNQRRHWRGMRKWQL